MANIRLKSIQELDSWNTKELRKLRITIKNRIESLSLNSKKKLPTSHPLCGLEVQECRDLLEKVKRAQKHLSR